MTASGCFGYGLEYKDYFNPNELGAAVLKGITMEPRNGNHGTRIAETPSGMLNSVGLENPGIEEFKKIIPTIKKELNIPVMHDDQHGTAIISGAALLNALEIVGKDMSEVKIVVNGAGASAISCTRIYVSLGAKKENISGHVTLNSFQGLASKMLKQVQHDELD